MTNEINPIYFAVISSVAVCALSSCESELETDSWAGPETEIIETGPLVPPSSDDDTTGSGSDSILSLNDGLRTDFHLDSNIKQVKGKRQHEITLKNGQKLRGAMIRMDDDNVITLEDSAGKRIRITPAEYTTVRILLEES